MTRPAAPTLLPPTLPDATPVGNALACRRDLLGFFMRLKREAGNFSCYSVVAGETIYFINDPALVREVLVRQEGSFLKWAFNETFRLIFGQGGIGSEEPLHGKMQPVRRPAFHQNRMGEYARVMVDTATARMAGWEEGEIDLIRETGAISLEIAARAFFSISLGGTLDAYLDAVSTALRLTGSFGVCQADDAAFIAAAGHFRELAAAMLARRREEGGGDGDLLALLLQAQVKDGETVTDAQIIDEICTFLIAGHATTAHALAAAFWLLSRDQETEAALHRELDSALGGRPPMLEDLPALVWCERIFLEALRLYPPVWALQREAKCEVSLGGCVLPAGAKLVISPWVLHRSPENFLEPERFLPARWGDGARERLPRGAYIPFSMGSRSCMGERFGMAEGILLLAAIAQRWRFEPAPRQKELRCKPHLILWIPGGIWLRAMRRPLAKPPTTDSHA